MSQHRLKSMFFIQVAFREDNVRTTAAQFACNELFTATRTHMQICGHDTRPP